MKDKIIVKEPFLSSNGELVRICVYYELDGEKNVLWYEVSSEYKKFLVNENVDAFLVGLLFLGLRTGKDIYLEGKLSHRLFYSVQHYLIPALCLANPELIPIKVFPKALNDQDINQKKIAGTGLSCGVDSFATYYDHLNEQEPYEIEYFTFFNVGSHGSGGKSTLEIFNARFEKATKFANKVNKKIIKINSNLSEVLNMKFQETNTLRNASAVLILQKLFRNYYIASKNRFDYFKLHAFDTQDYDSLILNFLSTESTTLFSAVANLTRVERTALIASHPATYISLDVCTSRGNYKNEVNCSKCNKCLRTALTLDLLGKLHLYDKVFDIERYRKYKYSYIWHIMRKKDKGQIEKNLYELIKQEKELRFFPILKSRINFNMK